MLTSAMDVLTYPCGTSFTELNDDSGSQDSDSIYSVVYVRKNLNCQRPVDVTYYSAGYSDIYCRHWGSDDILNVGSKVVNSDVNIQSWRKRSSMSMFIVFIVFSNL